MKVGKMKQRRHSFFNILIVVCFIFSGISGAYGASSSPENYPDIYAGMFLGTATTANLGSNAISLPFEGGIKAGIYPWKYLGFETSLLIGSLSTGNQFSVGGQTITTTSTTTSSKNCFLGCASQTSTTRTTITSPITGSLQNESGTLLIQSLDVMLRYPTKFISIYGGIGPALVILPEIDSAALSAKIGMEIPLKPWSVFVEDQIVTMGNTQFYSASGTPMFNFIQGGVNYHF